VPRGEARLVAFRAELRDLITAGKNVVVLGAGAALVPDFADLAARQADRIPA